MNRMPAGRRQVDSFHAVARLGADRRNAARRAEPGAFLARARVFDDIAAGLAARNLDEAAAAAEIALSLPPPPRGALALLLQARGEDRFSVGVIAGAVRLQALLDARPN